MHIQTQSRQSFWNRLVEPAPGFLEGLKAICHEKGSVLIFDEMITGF